MFDLSKVIWWSDQVINRNFSIISLNLKSIQIINYIILLTRKFSTKFIYRIFRLTEFPANQFECKWISQRESAYRLNEWTNERMNEVAWFWNGSSLDYQPEVNGSGGLRMCAEAAASFISGAATPTSCTLAASSSFINHVTKSRMMGP